MNFSARSLGVVIAAVATGLVVSVLVGQRLRDKPTVAQHSPSARFIDHGEYVEDKQTRLLWQKDGLAAGKLNFYEAARYAETLSLGGLDGWRVPTIAELAIIFPATDPIFLNTGYEPQTPGSTLYWTSELDTRLPDYAYVYQWYAEGGANNGTASLNFCRVRAVHDPIPGKPSR
jgi:Protein of unknown function (DUF1566)